VIEQVQRKFISLDTGEIVARNKSIKTSHQNSSIIHHLDQNPVMAISDDGRKIAVASENGIEILVIEI
ncbi:MAG: hypothetical protein AAFV07_19765, partial [Bacteroidota bacterium]